jgi:plastocyanin
VLSIATTADAELSFDTDTLEAPAGTEVTVSYDNQSTVPHNIAFYEGDSRESPILGRTEVETGPVVQEVTFTTPEEPGNYLFVCEVHPEIMQGTLVVS